jgi:hypothetical protein
MHGAMQLAMHPEAIYGYSLWAITALVIGGAVLGVLVIEGAARRLVRQDLRSAHNDVAGALVGVIGTTYAVLLAFVAMLAWEGFQQAETAAHAEAAAIRDVVAAFDGLPDITAMRAAVTDYTLAVVQVEWPAQARGEPVAVDSASLDRLNALASVLRPGSAGEVNLHARLLTAVTRLADERAERLRLAAGTIPAIIWTTLLMGGGLTLVAASFLGAPSLLMHLAMSSVLAVSGALVLVLIVALGNPFRGDFRVSSEPYSQVLERLGWP